MSSKAITDTTPGTDFGREPPARPPRGREQAPSAIREEDVGVARYVGLAGAMLVIVGGILLVAIVWFNRRPPVIGPAWASVMLLAGLVGLLYHAAFDRDAQFRFLYMVFGFAAVAAGAALCLLPYPNAIGDQFKAGFPCMGLGLLFLLAFMRNEDDRKIRDITQYVLLGVGAVLFVVGVVGGNLNGGFLLNFGLPLSLLGLVFLAAFVGTRGISDDLAYRVGLGVGAAGALVFLLALGRSIYALHASKYLIPDGILLMSVAAAAVLLSVGLCSDARLVVLTRRELGAFFYSPIAYFVLFGFIIVQGVAFAMWVGGILRSDGAIPEPIVTGFVLQWPPVVLFIFIPAALTMRLFSEERRTGTLEVLFTTPVNEPTVVLSKFIACFILFQIIWVPFFLYLLALRVMGGEPFDFYPLLSFVVGLSFSGAGLLSMGLFFSSLTRNQLVSGVLTVSGTMFFTFIFLIRMIISSGRSPSAGWSLVLQHMSYLDLWITSMSGKLEIKYLIFHASLAVFFLFLTVKVMEARKWL